MLGVVVNGILRNGPAPIVIERFAGVRVDVEAREVAAGNVEADAMAAWEHQRSRIHLDGELIDFSRFHQRRLLEGITVSRAHNAVRNIQVHACRE